MEQETRQLRFLAQCDRAIERLEVIGDQDSRRLVREIRRLRGAVFEELLNARAGVSQAQPDSSSRHRRLHSPGENGSGGRQFARRFRHGNFG
jgi:hypothetical protein